MRAKLLISMLAFGAALATAGSAWAASPQKGLYSTFFLISNLSGSCGKAKVGSTDIGSFFYPGPKAKGAVMHRTHIDTVGDYFDDVITFEAKTPGGLGSWSGKFTATKHSFTSGSTTGTGTFQGVFAAGDKTSFLFQVTLTAKGCAETFSTTDWLSQ